MDALYPYASVEHTVWIGYDHKRMASQLLVTTKKDMATATTKTGDVARTASLVHSI
jgi:hypothetical protein